MLYFCFRWEIQTDRFPILCAIMYVFSVGVSHLRCNRQGTTEVEVCFCVVLFRAKRNFPCNLGIVATCFCLFWWIIYCFCLLPGVATVYWYYYGIPIFIVVIISIIVGIIIRRRRMAMLMAAAAAQQQQQQVVMQTTTHSANSIPAAQAYPTAHAQAYPSAQAAAYPTAQPYPTAQAAAYPAATATATAVAAEPVKQ